MKKYQRNLLILNIIYTMLAVFSCITGFLNLLNEELGLFLLIVLFIVLVLGTISIWLFYFGKLKVSLVIFKIKKIIKTITILFLLWIIIMLLFVAQDCANAFGQNNEISSVDRIQVAWPFVLIGIFYLTYMIIYFVFFKQLENSNVSNTTAIVVIVANVINIVSLIIYSVLMIYNILLVINFILYIITLIISSFIIFNKKL